MTWEIHVMNDSEYNIYSWGDVSLPCVLSYMTDIVSIYWWYLQSYIIFMSSMKYTKWNVKKNIYCLTDNVFIEGTMIKCHNDDKLRKIKRKWEYWLYVNS